jgi:hypothetical protein
MYHCVDRQIVTDGAEKHILSFFEVRTSQGDPLLSFYGRWMRRAPLVRPFIFTNQYSVNYDQPRGLLIRTSDY